MRLIGRPKFKKKIYRQAPVYVYRPDGDYSSWNNINKKRVESGKIEITVYCRPKQTDSWQSFAARYKLPQATKQTRWNTYFEYCRSPEFTAWKNRILYKYKYKCQKCGLKAVSAHHIKYRPWGTEKIQDGLALCWDCHQKMHAAQKGQ
jgi:predicted restriction endonuclease